MRIFSLLVVVLLTAGCACGVPLTPTVSPCAAPVSYASPCAAPGVSGYAITPASYARGALSVPGAIIECAGVHGGGFLKCVGQALVPSPVPEAVYGQAYSAQASPCAQPMAAPCSCEQTYQIPQTYTENVVVEETIMVPTRRTHIVPTTRTRMVPARLVPECTPAPQSFDPCGGAVQSAPQAAPPPPTGDAPPAGGGN